MDSEKANYEVTRMARLLGVTRQGYYAWRTQRQAGPGPRAQRRDEIDQAVRETFHASDDVYGAPRIARELAANGVAVDRKTVAASMRRQGLEGISPAMFTPVTTVQDPAARGFADHAQRRWDQGRLDTVWTSDITYLRTGEGWLYLAVVRDGHSRRVLGWAMDERQDAGLVDRALRMAHTLRGTVPDGLVFHADRGVQYTSQMLFETCEELGIGSRWDGPGCAGTTRWPNRSWATLKTEFYDRRPWPTRAEARREVARWIEIVYNRRRLHSSLDYTSPVAFEIAIEHDQAEAEEHTDQAQAADQSTTCGQAQGPVARAMSSSESVRPMMPRTIQGRRLPRPEVVRSEMRPPSALKMTAASAPGAMTIAVIATCSAASVVRVCAFSWIETVAGPSRAT